MHISSDQDRKLPRLKNFDYSADGAYFFTICTTKRENIFGEIREDKMILNNFGRIAEKCWRKIPDHFPNVKLDEFIVMPNHVHGVIWISNPNVGNKNFCSLPNACSLPNDQPKPWQTKLSRSLSSIVRGFKIGVTKWARQNTTIYSIWQKSFHDHIIRNDDELNNIRDYIWQNPINWENDENRR